MKPAFSCTVPSTCGAAGRPCKDKKAGGYSAGSGAGIATISGAGRIDDNIGNRVLALNKYTSFQQANYTVYFITNVTDLAFDNSLPLSR